MIKKVALYDFDNTIASGDSIFRLLKYDLSHRPYHCLYFIKTALYYILYLLHMISFEKAKSTLLFPLNCMSDQQLCDFYIQHIEPTYYDHIVELINQQHQEGYYIIVCTASSEAYMRYHRLNVDALLGTKTKRRHHHATNQIIGKNCKGEEKVSRITEHLKSKDIQIDYEHSIGYSDSTSDLPMLSLVSQRKKIALKTGEISDFSSQEIS